MANLGGCVSEGVIPSLSMIFVQGSVFEYIGLRMSRICVRCLHVSACSYRGYDPRVGV